MRRPSPPPCYHILLALRCLNNMKTLTLCVALLAALPPVLSPVPSWAEDGVIPVPAPVGDRPNRPEPPRLAYDAELDPIRAALARTSKATVYQLGGEWDKQGNMRDTTGVVAGYFVSRSEPAPSNGWIDSLKSILSTRETYTLGEMLCIAIPAYAIRFRGKSDSVTVVLSSGCSRVDVKPARGAWFGGWASSATVEGELRALLASALPPAPDSARRSAEGLRDPHTFRDRDCTCTVREGEFLYSEHPPVLVHSPSPSLPDSVRSNARQLVRVHVLVDTAGLPCRIKAIDTFEPFAALAVSAARAWRWTPAMSNRKPTCVWTNAVVKFEPLGDRARR